MNTVVQLVPPRRILLVDDDPGIRTLVASYLARHGCVVDTAGDTREMRERLAADRYDLLVLDLMMPGEDGLSALRRLQLEPGGAPPVIMISAVGNDIDRIIGLELGADDYLAKPCNPRELLVRIATVLRRPSAAKPGGELLRFTGWTMDLAGRTLRNSAGTHVHLTDGEFSLLRMLAAHPQRLLTRDQLLDLARGPDSDHYDRAIDVQVSRLRRKLGAGDLIRTVRNGGYMFTVQPERA